MADISDHHFEDVCVVLCGEAGQGIQTVAQILVQVLFRCGYHVYATKEYMSRVRGGSNSTELRIGRKAVEGIRRGSDILISIASPTDWNAGVTWESR